MNTQPQNKLADALERATESARKGVVQSAALRRTDRELLLQGGYLQEIFKGWYFLGRPGFQPGESTAWYATFWDFLAVYLAERFGDDYCLSAVASLDVHIGTNLIPRQVVAITAHGGKTLLNLPHGTSLLVYADAENIPNKVETVNGLRVMPLPLALCRAPLSFFQSRPTDAELALRSVQDVQALVRIILETNSATLAGRFVAAYEFLGDTKQAQEIAETVRRVAGLAFKSENPFERPTPALAAAPRTISPYAGRIEAMFRAMRADVLEVFKDIKPKPVRSVAACLHKVDDVYQTDAYNSLSIEGYRVTPEMIRRIREGRWDPDRHPQDANSINAMAAKGYLEAFRIVKASIRTILEGKGNAVEVTRRDHPKWYQGLFAESVKAGLMEKHQLIGYRNDRVYIRASRHVPPPAHAVNDAMAALFDLLHDEDEAIVRAVLGHFLFGFIHPYQDGNGRMARFIMNAMLVVGGYRWTVVRLMHRQKYMAALEKASTGNDIVPFATFIREEMSVDWQR